MPTLKGKVIVITGASSGIGAATAIELAHAGAKLVLGARRQDRLLKVAEQCNAAARDSGGTALTLDCDVSKQSDVARLLTHATATFGRLDILLANAGYGFLAKVHETTEQQFDDIVNTNVKGTWYAMQLAADIMLKQKPLPGEKYRGHIIAVSSGAARRGLPLYGLYAMTKAAQLSLCEAMRVELKSQRIYVSSVHPLTTSTEFFEVASAKSRLKSSGLGRPQSAERVASKIARLMRHPKPELWPVPLSRYSLAFAAAFPRIADYVMAKTINSRTR